LERAAFDPGSHAACPGSVDKSGVANNEGDVMEKAHLYEALYLVNHGIDEAVRGVQRLKKSPKLFMETYHKSIAGLERRRSRINLQFMLEMRKLEEDDECRFEEEYNVWLADEPLSATS
jgi:hypothetical protein